MTESACMRHTGTSLVGHMYTIVEGKQPRIHCGINTIPNRSIPQWEYFEIIGKFSPRDKFRWRKGRDIVL